MTVYRNKDCKTFIYDFWWRGERFRGTTFQTILEDAHAFEDALKVRLRRQAGGLLRPEDSPRFSAWAEIFFEHQEQRLRAPRAVDDSLRVILRFWGRRPGPNSKVKVEPDAPYHDLHLADPIERPEWIERFEGWVAARGVANGTRNHYFSCLSQMYRAAMLPKYRKQTGIAFNPFAGIPKARTTPRNVTLTVDQIRAWLTQASYHVRLAAAIAALAPKLRVANILALEWGKHVDRQLTYLTVYEHKTAGSTGRPLVAAIPRQLKRILLDAKSRRPESKYVVTYRGRRVKYITAGVAEAFKAAGIPQGLKNEQGATFHTIRHSMSTLLAEMDETEASRQALMGHEDPATTKKYTHLRPVRERAAAERLSRAVKIADLVTMPHLRVKRHKTKTGTTLGTGGERIAKQTKSLLKSRRSR